MSPGTTSGDTKSKVKEKELEKLVLVWGRVNKVDLTVVDSRAVFSPKTGRFTGRTTSEVVTDLIGNYKDLSVWIELKAPGRKSGLTKKQADFLIRKINQGCFAVCIDSVGELHDVFEKFIKTRNKKLLFATLPKKYVSEFL